MEVGFNWWRRNVRGSMHEKLYDACPGERRNRSRQVGRRPSVLGELSKAQIRQRRPDSHSAPGSVPLGHPGVTTLFCVGRLPCPGTGAPSRGLLRRTR